MPDRILNDETLQLWNAKLEADRAASTWTEVQDVYLGNGKIPTIVVIPLAERDAPWLSIYCIDALVDPKQIFQVFNNFAGLTFDNSNAGVMVRIGKPPKGTGDNSANNSYQFTPDQPYGLALGTGGSGALPNQVAQHQQSFQTHDRVFELKIYPPETGLILNLTPGVFRIDNEMGIWEGGAFFDPSDYIPVDSGMAVWILLAIDIDNAPQVTAGTEFTAGTQSRVSAAPRTVPDGTMQLAWVYLYEGMTEFVKDDIYNNQDAPTGINQSEVIIDAEFSLTDDSGELLTDDSGQVLSGAA